MQVRVVTAYANRLWGRGRLIQLAVRWWHSLRGHSWTDWNMDAPLDELGRPIEPEPHTLVLIFRGCQGECGAVQYGHMTFSQFNGTVNGEPLTTVSF